MSADDELIQFNRKLGDRLRRSVSGRIESHPEFDSEMDNAQQTAEQCRFQQRADLYRQDQWLNDVLTTVAEKDTPQVSVAQT